MPKRIAIFASGSGSNAEKIINHFVDHSSIVVDRVYTNNEFAGVINRAGNFGIKATTFKKTSEIIDCLVSSKTDIIVLAGYLKLIPKNLIQLFPQKIINIHPALLPNYGGRGMYGMNVHNAVFENKEKKSGISIHYVNEQYDDGAIIFQKEVNIEDCNSAEEVAKAVLNLEHRHYPNVIEKLLSS